MHCLRHVLKAVSYVLTSGCAWRLRPCDFSPPVEPSTIGSGNGSRAPSNNLMRRLGGGAHLRLIKLESPHEQRLQEVVRHR